MDRHGIEALAAIADPVRIRVLAALLEDADAPDGRPGEPDPAALAARTGLPQRLVERSLRRLEAADLWRPDGRAGGVQRLAEAAAAATAERPLERALRPGSRLRGLVELGILRGVPTKVTAQAELAEALARTLVPFVEASEPALNAHLADVHDDVALLRRLLVDHGWLDRDPAVQTYRPGDRLAELWRDGDGAAGAGPAAP